MKITHVVYHTNSKFSLLVDKSMVENIYDEIVKKYILVKLLKSI